MFNIFKKSTLTNLGNFNAKYEMSINSQTVDPQESNPLELNTRIAVNLSQRIEKNRLLNTISSKLIDNDVSDPKFLPLINTATIVSSILKQIGVERNLSGELKKITNKKQILDFWHKWKTDKLDNYFPILEDQERFVEMMDASLPKIDINIKNEFQYLILLPECFYFKNYINKSDRTSLYSYTPKFAICPDFEYRLETMKVEESNDTLTIYLKSFWINATYIKDYLGLNNNNLSFTVLVKYCLDKASGQILSAKLRADELLHENLKNTVNITLDKV